METRSYIIVWNEADSRWLTRAVPGNGVRGIHKTHDAAVDYGKRLAKTERCTCVVYSKAGKVAQVILGAELP